jgi:hypothetical protein
MSQKFEQLLDYLVNEETDKANELFHEIVVEKSREIYEDLINEEIETEAKDEDMEEAKDEDMDESADESMEEAADEDMDEAKDEDMEEAAEELEDSYVMDGEDNDHDFEKGDATDELGAEVMAGDDDMDDMGDDESDEDQAIFDIKNAIEELEAAFAELEKAQGHEGDDEFGDDDMDADDDMNADEPMMGVKEGKRLTREYVEKVGNDWEKNSQKAQGKAAGADTGESMGSPAEGKSPVSSGKGKPTTGADSKNIAQGEHGENQDGTKPHGKAGGLVSAAKDMKTGNGNVPGGKMGVKNLSKVAHGHGAEKKGAGPGPVGAGTGDKAGQTSVGNEKSVLGSKKL